MAAGIDTARPRFAGGLGGTRRAGRRRRSRAWLEIAPAAVYFAVFFLAPLGILVAYSFYTYRDFDFVPDFTVQNYLDVITGDRYHTYFLRTVKIAFIVSALVLVISYPFAYLLTFVFRRRRELLYFLVLVSLFGGYLVRIYAWRTMLGREGLINEGLMSAGVIDNPLGFFLNSEFAIVITLVNFLLPLGVLPLFSAMQNVSPRQLEAARDLGSSRLHAARRVVLPLTMRGVRAAFAFTFIAAAAEWVTPLLVGGVGDQLVGNQIAYEFGTDVNWPLGAALAMTLVVATVAIVAAILGLLRLVSR